MIKNKVKALILASLLMMGMGHAAMADTLSVGVSVPVKQEFTDIKDDVKSTSGFMLEVQLPMMVGFGYESYESKLDMADNSDISIATTMYDVFYTLDLSLVSFTIGAGLGDVAIKGDYEAAYEKGKASQTFWRLGIPVMPLFSINVGQNNVKADIEGVAGNPDDVDARSTVTALGVSFGF